MAVLARLQENVAFRVFNGGKLAGNCWQFHAVRFIRRRVAVRQRHGIADSILHFKWRYNSNLPWHFPAAVKLPRDSRHLKPALSRHSAFRSSLQQRQLNINSFIVFGFTYVYDLLRSDKNHCRRCMPPFALAQWVARVITLIKSSMELIETEAHCLPNLSGWKGQVEKTDPPRQFYLFIYSVLVSFSRVVLVFSNSSAADSRRRALNARKSNERKRNTRFPALYY